MGQMKSYVWDEKERRSNVAKDHYNKMEKTYSNDINNSIKNTILYEQEWDIDENDEKYKYTNPKSEIIVEPLSSSQAVAKYCNTPMASSSIPPVQFTDNKIAVLNFASFKHPGGAFLQGSRAQEECLCHDSTLYNVLSRFQKDYYNINIHLLNNGLYTSRILYSPDIVFDFQDKYIDGWNHEVSTRVITKVDVITAAAPNAGTYLRYRKGPKEAVYAAMLDRINKIMSIAIEQKVNVLILGAFGCGVFKNDPKEVAEIFRKVIDGRKDLFENIKFVFAIPIVAGNNKYNNNFITFKKILEG